MSQRALAQRIGKPPSFINKIELLERRLDVLEFIAIARALDVSPEALLERMQDALPREFSL
jgi:transcriptional regulator with XRE-family HTH domain